MTKKRRPYRLFFEAAPVVGDSDQLSSAVLNLNGNLISIKAIEELSDEDIKTKYSFSLFDEIHKYIKDPDIYETLHSISNNSDNILALSATPVHQRGEEYLKLLRLIHPEKYDHLEYKDFEKLWFNPKNCVKHE